MQDNKTSEREPRVMLIAGQNETVRKTASQKGFPATVGLEGCVALIIADKKGNVSLTHVDSDTDLSFITNEVAFMDGEFTIDLIKKKGVGELELKILGALDEMKLSDSKSSGKKRVVETNEGTVVYNYLKGTPQGFSFKDFREIATPGVKPSETNKLHTLGYSVQTCVDDPFKFQLRIYSRQLNQCCSSTPAALPLLVHDATGWLEKEMRIDDEVKLILDKETIRKDTFFSSSKMSSFNHVYPHYKMLVEHLNSLEEKPSTDL